VTADAAPPRFEVLRAPPAWRTVDFISDLHLHAAEPQTFEVWRRYMRETPADAVFILGDLFDVWVGDDAASEPGLASDCAAVIQATSSRAVVFVMHGNRDFLIGEGFARACGAALLADPTVLLFSGQRWLLTHGDALCLADTDYLKFRRQVRSQQWQLEFLSKPLAQRQAIGADLRSQSEARKAGGAGYADVDSDAALAWLTAADAPVLIHGHTHRPAEHALDATRRRVVLSDWDAAARPARAQVLRLTASGLRRVPLS
jgi:UDP-2,3-diacylglucosamine hydrolase